MEKPYHSIASDFQRNALIQVAMRRAAEIARESFYHGLMADDFGDAEMAIFAEDAWQRFSVSLTFDYPDYAHDLFLRAYRLAYRAHVEDLPRGVHPNTFVLAELLDEEMHQAHADRGEE